MPQLSDFHYLLPDELIAQSPLSKRSDSRLLVLHGKTIDHRMVRELPALLNPGDCLVFNNTRVIPARLFGEKQTGGKLELMLERISDNGMVLAKIRCSKSPKPGTLITLFGRDKATATATVMRRLDDLFELSDPDNNNEKLSAFIEQHAEIPLPPYINRKPDATDSERYQTVFAEIPGAVAAPTAGLHFDQALFAALKERRIRHTFITLHVGAGTFQPVRVDDLLRHTMHAERVHVSEQAVDQILSAKNDGGRIIAVGTTCVRSLEAAAMTGSLQPYSGETRLFITPGTKFNIVDGIVTNFHLPESTLLMLVAAFAGLNNTLAAYRQAVENRYRFFSYGDAMLAWPNPAGCA
jgi:S-adenosylmethionine:tRNA ribosyltransferase-isomerase